MNPAGGTAGTPHNAASPSNPELVLIIERATVPEYLARGLGQD
jgi:hypothetical protein